MTSVSSARGVDRYMGTHSTNYNVSPKDHQPEIQVFTQKAPSHTAEAEKQLAE